MQEGRVVEAKVSERVIPKNAITASHSFFISCHFTCDGAFGVILAANVAEVFGSPLGFLRGCMALDAQRFDDKSSVYEIDDLRQCANRVNGYAFHDGRLARETSNTVAIDLPPLKVAVNRALFNRPNFNLPDAFLASPTFGRIISADSPRRCQFGVRIIF